MLSVCWPAEEKGKGEGREVQWPETEIDRSMLGSVIWQQNICTAENEVGIASRALTGYKGYKVTLQH